MQKVVLITGTSTGLGVSLAVQAAAAGHTVYATMRDLAKRAALDNAAEDVGIELSVLELDVQDTGSVEKAVSTIVQEQGRIDTLINNAGAGFVRSTEQASQADIEWVLDVNLMGVIRCTKAVIGHMREAKAGHIINISSVGGLVGQPFNELYCAAKFAVEGYTEAMASYMTPSFGIHFTAVEPGGISTEFANNVLQQVQASGGMLEDEYLPVLQQYIGGSQTRQEGANAAYQTAHEVAEVVVDIINADEPPIRARTSEWAEELTRFKTNLDPDGSKQQSMVVERFLS